jgi:DNA-binding PadR family transcriptional regulator
MYRDNTLIPSEAIRLLALGILATGERPYGELAHEVRHFVGHVVGPSLDLVGAPIEVLKLEDLIEEARPGAETGTEIGTEPEPPLRITEAGRAELTRLLSSNLRAPVSDINKLIITLKMRFLHLLEPAERRLQTEIMTEMGERQLARLTELRGHHRDAPGHLTGWLDHEIDQTRERLDWFRNLQAGLE